MKNLNIELQTKQLERGVIRLRVLLGGQPIERASFHPSNAWARTYAGKLIHSIIED